MSRALSLAAVLLALSACASRPVVEQRQSAPPVPVACEAQCLAPCNAVLPRWQGAPDDPATWDALGELVAALRERIDVCEAARAACVRCLARLDRAGLTCGLAVPCLGEP